MSCLYIYLHTSGEKLQQAKQAILAIVENMINGDIIHIIIYDHNITPLIVNGKFDTIESKEKIIKSIQGISVGGATNLYGGIKAAFNAILSNVDQNDDQNGDQSGDENVNSMHSRIFLFSDGLANTGEYTKFETISNGIANLKQLASLRNKDIYISSFGIGNDFDRKLMANIADIGNGDFFYIQGPSYVIITRQVKIISNQPLIYLV